MTGNSKAASQQSTTAQAETPPVEARESVTANGEAAGNNQKVKFRVTAPGYRYPKWKYWLPMLSTACSDALLVSLPVLLGVIIDTFASGRADQAPPLLAALVFIILFVAVNEFIGFGISIRFIQELARDWRGYAAEKIKHLGAKTDPGEVISVVNKDSVTISQVVYALPDLAGGIVLTIVGSVQLWLIDPLVAVVGITGMVIAMILITLITKALESRVEKRREAAGINASRTADIATSLRTIAGLGAGTEMFRRYRKSALKLRQANLAYSRVSVWINGARLFLLGLITLLAVGFALCGKQDGGVWVTEVPPGQLVAVAGVITMMSGSLWVLEFVMVSIRNAKTSLRRMQRLADSAEANRANVLNGANGLNGSGSTSEAVSAFNPAPIIATAGAINYLDPRDYALTAQQLSEQLTAALRLRNRDDRVLLSQSNDYVFEGTLAEHLQLGTDGLSEQTMMGLLEITESTEIAWRLGGSTPEEFLAARITSEGANLSGGQRQRLALARTLAQGAAVIVLAEPLNSVDEPSQKYIYDRLEMLVGSPGLLQKTRQVYVVSTTAEAQRRAGAAERSGAAERGGAADRSGEAGE